MTLEERVEALEKELQEMKDIEAIKELKGKYFRCLDGKMWDELETTLSPNIVTSYSNGKLVFHSPKEVTDYLKSTMPKEEISMHMATRRRSPLTARLRLRADGIWKID